MRAVVMAGGEGTRLRPLTTSFPKPLLPIVDRPMLHHVLTHLVRHGVNESVVTVQFMAGLIRSYFGDGDEVGMRLDYTTDDRPLGTAGSVQRAADQLGNETFLVVSGDALTDIDLTALVEFHRDRGALATVALTRKPDPVDFGVSITDESGRIVRFLEKPSWGQVFSDTVNTGIYVFEPEILASIPAGAQADWSADVLPALLAKGAPVYGFVAEGYWEDVGTLGSYLSVQRDVLDGLVKVDIGGFQVAPGVWVAEGAEIDPEVSL
jgi:mannose-1-phosphate guanylyltransferase/phosphomannomutase